MTHKHDDDRGDTIEHTHDGPAGHRHATGRVTAMDLEIGAVEEYAVEYGPAYGPPITSQAWTANRRSSRMIGPNKGPATP